MYGTTEFAIDCSTGQLYTVGDVDVVPINLFGGIPDEDFDGKATESTWLPSQIPQAMSMPITEIPTSTLATLITPDSVPLPTPRIPVTHLEEGDVSTSISTLSESSMVPPHFYINRVNVRATSSVSSLDEGEGIPNGDDYERAVHWIGKINRKVTTLIKNWNEEVFC